MNVLLARINSGLEKANFKGDIILRSPDLAVCSRRTMMGHPTNIKMKLSEVNH